MGIDLIRSFIIQLDLLRFANDLICKAAQKPAIGGMLRSRDKALSTHSRIMSNIAIVFWTCFTIFREGANTPK